MNGPQPPPADEVDPNVTLTKVQLRRLLEVTWCTAAYPSKPCEFSEFWEFYAALPENLRTTER